MRRNGAYVKTTISLIDHHSLACVTTASVARESGKMCQRVVSVTSRVSYIRTDMIEHGVEHAGEHGEEARLIKSQRHHSHPKHKRHKRSGLLVMRSGIIKRSCQQVSFVITTCTSLDPWRRRECPPTRRRSLHACPCGGDRVPLAKAAPTATQTPRTWEGKGERNRQIERK